MVRNREALIWLRKQTVRKASNFARAWTAYQSARMFGPSTPGFMPVSLSVEPTTSCNLRCPECPSGLRSFTRATGKMDTTLFSHIVDELHPWLSNLTLYFQGEPFLHPSFTGLVAYASQKNVFTNTSTNGHYLTEQRCREVIESGLDRIIISIDGTTQETYEQYRKGGNLERVLEGTKTLVAMRQKLRSLTPFIQIQFLVVKPNEHQIPAMREWAAQCGVDEVRFKSAQIYEFENGSSLIPDDPTYSRYRRGEDGKWEIRSQWDDRCWRMWSSSVITWDGQVVPCCFDKDAQHRLGRIGETSFKGIWTGEAYEAFRRTVFQSRASVEMCRNCTEGLAVGDGI